MSYGELFGIQDSTAFIIVREFCHVKKVHLMLLVIPKLISSKIEKFIFNEIIEIPLFTPFLFKALLMQNACFGIYYYKWVGSIYALTLFKFVEVRKKGKFLPYTL